MNIEIYHYENAESVNARLVEFCKQVPNYFHWNQFPQEIILPEVREILDFFQTKLPAGEWRFYQWINVAWKDGFLEKHHHEADLAAVYHVHGDGDVVFEEGGEVQRLPAVPGQLLIWPAHYLHSVPEILSEWRISVGMHAFKVKK